MERKTFRAFSTKVTDADQGIVESIVAVMGNLDEGNDIIHPGAFTKTILERGRKIRVLDQHQTDSVMRVLGKPVRLRELAREELPSDLLTAFPSATGGLWAETQFLITTPEGKGAFERIKSGALDEWSIGYDALDFDYSKVVSGGKETTARNLRTIKLYEYSPVIFAMNTATGTLAAKSGEQPAEGKPYGVFRRGDAWIVCRVGEDGKPMGEPLGEHESEEEAQAQLRALNANEKSITDNDKRILERQLRGLNMTDLVATHRRLHQYAAQGHPLTGFSQADMNWFHAAAERELRRRAEQDDRDPPDPSPLEWASGKEEEVPPSEDDKHLPSQVGVIRDREEEEGASKELTIRGPDLKTGRRVRGDKIELLRQLSEITRQLMAWAEYEDEDEERDEEESPPGKQLAGPALPPTARDLVTIVGLELDEIETIL